jgi:hypothetical protein
LEIKISTWLDALFVEFVRLSQGETEKQAVSASRCGRNHIRMRLACANFDFQAK